jgi:glycosyltransferase involved in cell wall biosynthesis
MGSPARHMVSAIIPARNEEASIARAVESVAVQPEIGEVIVVNDQSTDRTSEILAELAARIPKLRVLATDGLPPGWTGKNYALSMGAAAAHGDGLLFTDADTYHLPGSTARALADAAEHNAALVSYSPEQELGTFWERALIPFVYWRLSKKYQFRRISDPRLPDAAANGQFLLIRSGAYTDLGGHAAIAGEILEDVALARRAKGSGHGIYFAPGFGIVRTRMYRTFGSMWQGWTKNLYPLLAGTKRSLLGELLTVFPWFEVITLIIVWAYLHKIYGVSGMFLPVLVAITLLERQLEYAVELRRNLFPAGYVQYYVPGVCLYTAALVASWWKNTHSAVVWKGRAYRARSS